MGSETSYSVNGDGGRNQTSRKRKRSALSDDDDDDDSSTEGGKGRGKGKGSGKKGKALSKKQIENRDKKKAKKALIDPDRPKPPPNAFLLFSHESRLVDGSFVLVKCLLSIRLLFFLSNNRSFPVVCSLYRRIGSIPAPVEGEEKKNVLG